MKKITLFFGLIIALAAAAQEKPPVDPFDIEKFTQLAKVWGTAKYFHPAVAKGAVDWDEALLKTIPAVDKARNAAEFNQAVQNMLQKLPVCNPVDTAVDQKTGHEYILSGNLGALYNFIFLKKNMVYVHHLNFEWIKENELLNEAVRESVLNTILCYQPMMHHNLRLNNPFSFYNTHFNEKKYNSTEKPYRLLALFRFWNLINYYYPYPEMIEGKWDQALQNMIPQFIQAENPLEYNLAVLQLIKALNDPQAKVESEALDQHFGNYKIPVEITPIEGRLVITDVYGDSAYFEPTLKIGDIILLIDSQEYKEQYKALAEHFPTQQAVQRLLNRKKDDLAVLTVQRGEEAFNVKIKKNMPDRPMANTTGLEVLKCRLINNKYGYVRLYEIDGPADLQQCVQRIQGAKNIIFDLRGEMKTDISNLIIGHYVEQPEVSYISKDPEYFVPGVINFSVMPVEPIKPFDTRKFVVLTDENTKNQSELVLLKMLATKQATSIGRKTAGVAGMPLAVYLPGDIKVTFTAQGGALTAEGRPIHNRGIEPNIVVKPSIEAVVNHTDPVLQRSVDFLEGK